MPNELMGTCSRYPLDRERERGMFQGTQVTGSHQTAHEAPDLVVAHGGLQFGGTDRRVAKPSSGSHRPLRQGSVLEKRYLELGRHGRRGLRLLLGAAILLVEPLHPACSVDQLLLTRVERMTGRADLHFDLRNGRVSEKRLAARARDPALNILRMYIVLQGASNDTSHKVISPKRKDMIARGTRSGPGAAGRARKPGDRSLGLERPEKSLRQTQSLARRRHFLCFPSQSDLPQDLP